jgi:transposase
MKILGLDVSKNKVTAFILAELPQDFKRFNRNAKATEYTADLEGITDLLNLDFDCAALEPSGSHYAKIWVHHLRKAGKPIHWVGHRQIKYFREINGLPNKNDKADAIAIAAYTLQNLHNPSAFIDGEGTQLREIWQQMQSLQRIWNPLINRLRQQLSHECPELADKAMRRGLLLAISGEKVSAKWDKEISRSIGLGIGSFSQGLARQLLDLLEQEEALERQMIAELGRPQYKNYVEVMERMDITHRTQAALLSHIYPIEKFLDKNGKPIIERNGHCKYYRSLAAFKLAVGMGRVQYQSGGELRWKNGGPVSVRSALWQWVVTKLLMTPDESIPEIVRLRAIWEASKGKKRNQRIMKVAKTLVEDLFDELIQSMNR